ncbi:hypothetical protein LguiB_026486 [Lonicera macranthoides]
MMRIVMYKLAEAKEYSSSIDPSFARRPRKKTSKKTNQVKAPISRLSIPGGNTFIARQITNLKDQCNLIPLEGDQEIFEEDAVCEICFNAFKVNEEMVKMKCKCESEELVHEACATKSSCGVCEQQIEKIHLILLQLPTDDPGVTTHNTGKKYKWIKTFSPIMFQAGDFNIGQATMQHNDEEDHVCISIGKKLDGLFPSSTGCFIFKVHNQLRKVNEKAYGPDIISTGPYHHGKNNLQMIEEHKLQYLEHRTKTPEIRLKAGVGGCPRQAMIDHGQPMIDHGVFCLKASLYHDRSWYTHDRSCFWEIPQISILRAFTSA